MRVNGSDQPRVAGLLIAMEMTEQEDGLSTLEAHGAGHFEALAWACRQRERKVFVLCVRRDQFPSILQRLGVDESEVARLPLASCEEPAERGVFVTVIEGLVGGGG